ncbi:MAG: AAA family ATPase [Planctomycetes bacterium]|nr:AAA family ATPase [Planctomycetota bacterium]
MRPTSHGTLTTSVAELEALLLGGEPILYIVSIDEERVEERVAAIAGRGNRKINCWSQTLGVYPRAGAPPRDRTAPTRDPLVALDMLLDEREYTTYLFKDLHPFLAEGHPQRAAVVRKLREIAGQIRALKNAMVIIAHELVLPPDLRQDVVSLFLPPADLRELGALLEKKIEESKRNPAVQVRLEPLTRELLLRSALGLSWREAQGVFGRILLAPGVLETEGIAAVLQAKRQYVEKSGLLQGCEASADLEQVGGFDQLKTWLKRRLVAFSERAREAGVDTPRGMLLFGPRGCGKGQVALSLPRLWQLPLFRLDLSAMHTLPGSAVGNLGKALALADSVAPCILWLDDIDRAFSRSEESLPYDGGGEARFMSTFIEWMASKTRPVFVVATAEEARRLPAELLGRGVLDGIYFLDLPTLTERQRIFEIHLARLRRDPATFNTSLLADRAEGFTGREIEQSLLTAVEESFVTGQPLTTEGILATLALVVPMSRAQSEAISNMRTWAEENGRFATWVSPDAVRRKPEAVVAPEPGSLAPGAQRPVAPPEQAAESVGDFTRFDPRAKIVIKTSRRETLRHGRNQVGWEHVLLALLKERQCLKEVQFLADHGLQGREVVKTLESNVPKAVQMPPDHGMVMEPTDELRMALTWATTEASRSGHAFMTPSHILLGILQIEAATRSLLVFPNHNLYAVQETLRRLLKS